jgi:cytochrome P450
VQANLFKELSNAKISNPIKDAEARELPYLQAVIKEGMRIFPPVTGLFLKEAPPGGDTLNGVFIPEGTCIGSSAFGVMRNPKIWGKDACLFRPERWLEGDSEEIQQKDLNLELVFGYGRYQCLGKNVARMELNKIFVEVRFFNS